jgi:membrane protease YdiL (CAAX protease family)
MTSAMDPESMSAWRGLLSSWDAWLLTFVLAVVVPALGYVRFRRFLRLVDRGVPTRVKLALYFKTMCSQWILVAVTLLVAWRHGLSAADLGERTGDTQQTLIVTLVLLLVLVVVSAAVLWRLRRASPEALMNAGGPLRKFVPVFGVEMAVFAGLCVTAGVCEELLYRGWLINFLRAASGSTSIAVVAGALAFGIGHAYQGVTGMLRTAFIGVQLALLFVAVGSLIPGQALHTGVDLLAGVAGAMAVSRSARAA